MYVLPKNIITLTWCQLKGSIWWYCDNYTKKIQIFWIFRSKCFSCDLSSALWTYCVLFANEYHVFHNETSHAIVLTFQYQLHCETNLLTEILWQWVRLLQVTFNVKCRTNSKVSAQILVQSYNDFCHFYLINTTH